MIHSKIYECLAEAYANSRFQLKPKEQLLYLGREELLEVEQSTQSLAAYKVDSNGSSDKTYMGFKIIPVDLPSHLNAIVK